MEKICIRVMQLDRQAESIPGRNGRKVFAGPRESFQKPLCGLPTFVTVVFTVLLSFIGGVVFTALPTYAGLSRPQNSARRAQQYELHRALLLA